MNILKNFTYDNTIFLIGNKSDLKEERKVTIEEGKKFKNDYDNINEINSYISYNFVKIF